MNIIWANEWTAIGNGYGYSRHTQLMKQHVLAHGVTLDKEAETAVHITTPPSFEPIQGKNNILFTMYEALSLPDEWIGQCQKADHLVVPCEWNKKLFGIYVKGKTIDVCPEGVEPIFKYEKREYKKGEKMVFLWIGASNERKGYRHCIEAWLNVCDKVPGFKENTRLIMKTTQVTREERVVAQGNVTIDTRNYSQEKLLALYYMAHAFIFPSMGEGWGLTLHEAAATGLPCIYPHHSGMADFMKKEFAYPIKFRPRSISVVRFSEDGKKETYNKTQAMYPDVADISKRIIAIYEDYTTATERAEKQAEHVHKFTWEKAAKKLIDIITNRSAITTQAKCA